MHFMKVLNPDNMGAEHFVDDNMNPISARLVIESVKAEKPPTGGKEKACFRFVGKDKKAFFANTQVKKIARTLRQADTDKWAGTELTITAKETKFAGKPCMGMVITHINGKEV